MGVHDPTGLVHVKAKPVGIGPGEAAREKAPQEGIARLGGVPVGPGAVDGQGHVQALFSMGAPRGPDHLKAPPRGLGAADAPGADRELPALQKGV